MCGKFRFVKRLFVTILVTLAVYKILYALWNIEWLTDEEMILNCLFISDDCRVTVFIGNL